MSAAEVSRQVAAKLNRREFRDPAVQALAVEMSTHVRVLEAVIAAMTEAAHELEAENQFLRELLDAGLANFGKNFSENSGNAVPIIQLHASVSA